MSTLVAGVDGTPRGWVAVLLRDGCFEQALLLEGVENDLAALGDAVRIGIDVPIGFGPRAADRLAQQLVGGTVFTIPERSRFAVPFGPGGGISAQAHALGPRIVHMTRLRERLPLLEVHPEVCFRAMNGGRRLEHRKKVAGGALERIELLRREGIEIDPARLGEAGRIPLDDLLDAAACAWTAAKPAPTPLPDPPELVDGVECAIWV